MDARVILATALLMTVWVAAGATTFYISSSSGSDSNPGTNPNQAWKSFARVRSRKSFNKGDAILLKRGDRFFDNLDLVNTANGVLISDYGPQSLPAPVISGAQVLPSSGWANVRGKIWKIRIPQPPQALMGVWYKGAILLPARTKLFTQTDCNMPTTNWFFSPDLRGQPDNKFAGTDCVLRSAGPVWSRVRVTSSSSSGRVQLADETFFRTQTGWSFFFDNSLQFLDAPGEYFYEHRTLTLYVWLPDSASPNGNKNQVLYTARAEGVSTRQWSGVTVQNLRVEFQSRCGICADNLSGGGTIQNNDVYGQNEIGIEVGRSTSGTIQLNTIRQVSVGIKVPTSVDTLITKNSISDCGMHSDVFTRGTNDGVAVFIQGSGSTVSRNVIRRTGCNGIRADGVSHLIANNFIDSVAMIQNDCGAFYAFGTDSHGTTIRGNVITNVIGSVYATPIDYIAHAIYLDGETWDFTVDGNTIVNVRKMGVLINGGHGHSITGNTMWGCRGQGTITMIERLEEPLGNIVVQNNQIYLGITGIPPPGTPIDKRRPPYDVRRNRVFAIMEVSQREYGDAPSPGLYDRNLYWSPAGCDLLMRAAWMQNGRVVSKELSLSGWQSWGLDKHSVVGPYKTTGYTYTVLKNGVINPARAAWSFAPSQRVQGAVLSANSVQQYGAGARSLCSTGSKCALARVQQCPNGNTNFQDDTNAGKAYVTAAGNPAALTLQGSQWYLFSFTFVGGSARDGLGTLNLAATPLRSGTGLGTVNRYPVDCTPRRIDVIVNSNVGNAKVASRVEFQAPCSSSVLIKDVTVSQVTNVKAAAEEGILWYNAGQQDNIVNIGSTLYQDPYTPNTWYCRYIRVPAFGSVLLARGKSGPSAAQRANCKPFAQSSKSFLAQSADDFGGPAPIVGSTLTDLVEFIG